MRNHILVIVSDCSRSEMIWIDARRIVATVKNMLLFRDWSFQQFPCDSMSTKSLCMGIIPDKSVMMFRVFVGYPGTNPKPTSAKFWIERVKRSNFIHLAPKAFFEWCLNKVPMNVSLHIPMISSVGTISREVRL